MKIRLLSSLFVSGGLSLGLANAFGDVAVFSSPDARSAVIARVKSVDALKAGATTAPSGWRSVEVSGPFEVYVASRDITKSLEVREGAHYFAAPRKDAALFGTAAKGDKTDVTGIHGDYCQVKLGKAVTGFIATGENANLPAQSPVVAAPAVTAAPATAATTGRPVNAAGTADLPRTFQGRLVSAARPLLLPNPIYDYQLVDAEGHRIAYLDLKRANLTSRVEDLAGSMVSVEGLLRNSVDGKDLVIAAESVRPAR